MNAAAETKLFGLSLKLNSKVLLGSLLALAAFLFWYESGDNNDSPAPSPTAIAQSGHLTTLKLPKARPLPHRRASSAERNRLELRMVDITESNIDPSLRLDLLAHLQAMSEPGKTRNVFETVKKVEEPKQEIQGPVIDPGPPVVNVPLVPTAVEIPFSISLKYCGFLKSQDLGKDRRGFFLDGDRVLIGSEGDILSSRYRIVTLNSVTAELEDLEVMKKQTLTLVAKVNP